MLKHILATVFMNVYIVFNIMLYLFSINHLKYCYQINDNIVPIFLFNIGCRAIESVMMIIKYINIVSKQKFSCSIFLKNEENIDDFSILENNQNSCFTNAKYSDPKLSLAFSLLSTSVSFIYFAVSLTNMTIFLVIYNVILCIGSIVTYFILINSS